MCLAYWDVLLWFPACGCCSTRLSDDSSFQEHLLCEDFQHMVEEIFFVMWVEPYRQRRLVPHQVFLVGWQYVPSIATIHKLRFQICLLPCAVNQQPGRPNEELVPPSPVSLLIQWPIISQIWASISVGETPSWMGPGIELSAVSCCKWQPPSTDRPCSKYWHTSVPQL